MNWRWTFWVRRIEERQECPEGLWKAPDYKIEILTRDLRIVSGRPQGFCWGISRQPSDVIAWRVREDHPIYEKVIRNSTMLIYEGELPDESKGKIEASESMVQAAAERHPLFGAWA